MISYIKEKSNLKNNVKQVALSVNRRKLITGIILLAFALFYIFVGIFDDTRAYVYGFIILYFALIYLIQFFVRFFKMRKYILSEFAFTQAEVLEFTIENIDNQYYIINNLTLNTKYVFNENDIFNVTLKPNYIIVKFSYSKILCFPRTEELENLFKKSYIY